MQSTRNKLIEILSESSQKNDYISGQLLSEKLGISRSAIWKHMNELKKDGYIIEGVSRKGYKIISYPNKLSENTIKWGLETNWLGHHIIHKESVLSTQKIAHIAALEGAEHGTIVIADEQTSGKGRADRSFHSKKDEGIWMSIILRPEILPYDAPQLTLLTATVLAQVLDDYKGITPQIKWPNDILINGKKVAGILTEMQAEQDKVLYIIIGIGLNVNQSLKSFPEELHSKVTSLSIETGTILNMTDLIQQIIKSFEEKFDSYLEQGFPNIKTTWEKYGFKINEILEITTSKETWQGKFLGIAEDGALLAERYQGKVEKVYSAEISWFQ